MLRLRLPTLFLIMTLGLGLMGGALLAQQSAAITVPSPIDCSPEALDVLTQSMSEQLPTDFAADSKEATANLYRRALVYEQIALACNYAPSMDEVNLAVDLTRKVADLSVLLQPQPVSGDSTVALTQIEMLVGDPTRGQALFTSQARSGVDTVLGCSACHAAASVAPAPEVIWDRTLEKRLALPSFADYTPDHYVVESIVNPSAYVVPGFVVTMPATFGDHLLPQDLADIVAYLRSLSTR